MTTDPVPPDVNPSVVSGPSDVVGFSILEVTGSRYEVGLSHGESLRDVVRDLAELRVGLLRRSSTWPVSDLDDLADDLWRFQEHAVPEVHREIDGIRVGAGLTRLEVLVAGALSDIVDIVDRGLAPRFPECTTVVSRTDPDRPLLFGTWDTQPGAQPSLVAIRRRLHGEPEVVGLTSAGTPIQQFVNAFGVAGAINNLKPTTAGVGVLFPAALAHMCGAASTREAARRLGALRYASGHYYPLNDPSTGLGIETTTSGTEILLPGHHQRVVHTNHYLAPDLISAGITYHDTVERFRFTNSVLVDDQPDTAWTAWELLGRRADQAGHARLARDESDVRTCAAFVIDPVARTVEFTSGPPLPSSPHHTIAVSTPLS